MSAIYENLSPSGHDTMVTRIFQKIKNWVETVFQKKSATMTYAAYQQLTTAEKNDGTIRFLTDVPDLNQVVWYDAQTEYINFLDGYASYDSTTEYITIL